MANPFHGNPLHPIEWQGLDAKANRLHDEARVMRWICGDATADDEPVTRWDIDRLGFMIVRKPQEGTDDAATS